MITGDHEDDLEQREHDALNQSDFAVLYVPPPTRQRVGVKVTEDSEFAQCRREVHILERYLRNTEPVDEMFVSLEDLDEDAGIGVISATCPMQP